MTWICQAIRHHAYHKFTAYILRFYGTLSGCYSQLAWYMIVSRRIDGIESCNDHKVVYIQCSESRTLIQRTYAFSSGHAAISTIASYITSLGRRLTVPWCVQHAPAVRTMYAYEYSSRAQPARRSRRVNSTPVRGTSSVTTAGSIQIYKI